MNRNNSNIAIIIFSCCYLFIVSIIICNSVFNTNTIKDITIITTSFTTLIIALLLYDRFNYRKIIFERKLDIVLNLLEKLKKTQIQIIYNNINENIIFSGVLSIDRQEIKNLISQKHFNNRAYIILEANEIRDYLDEILSFKTNPFMPIEIVKSLDFLSMTYFESVERNEKYQNEYVKISINRRVINPRDLKDWCNTGQNISFYTFIENYIRSLDEIENWINKHSNEKIKLNL